MKKALYELSEEVADEESLLLFLEALYLDKEDEEIKEKLSPGPPYSPGVNGWENGDIPSFLEAAIAWGEVSKNGLEFYEKPNNPWQRIAQILHAGKFYE